jgi:hypothetical protein
MDAGWVRSMAMGTLDGHASSSLIDNEVIAASLTFEEDIGNLLIPGGRYRFNLS